MKFCGTCKHCHLNDKMKDTQGVCQITNDVVNVTHTCDSWEILDERLIGSNDDYDFYITGDLLVKMQTVPFILAHARGKTNIYVAATNEFKIIYAANTLEELLYFLTV